MDKASGKGYEEALSSGTIHGLFIEGNLVACIGYGPMSIFEEVRDDYAHWLEARLDEKKSLSKDIYFIDEAFVFEKYNRLKYNLGLYLAQQVIDAGDKATFAFCSKACKRRYKRLGFQEGDGGAMVWIP